MSKRLRFSEENKQAGDSSASSKRRQQVQYSGEMDPSQVGYQSDSSATYSEPYSASDNSYTDNNNSYANNDSSTTGNDFPTTSNDSYANHSNHDSSATATGNNSSSTATDTGESSSSARDRSSLRLERLEERKGRCGDRLESAYEALPKKKKLSRKRIYDEEKKKAKSKLTFEEQVILLSEAKWNQPKKKSVTSIIDNSAKGAVMREVHGKIYAVEDDNVGVKSAHRGELVGESIYRSGKQAAGSAYQFHKNRPYRKAARLELKSAKAQAKLNYQKALREHSKRKGNLISKFFQKRAIKRKYATVLRNAKKSAKGAGKSVGFMGKVAKLVTGIIRKNPVLLLKLSGVGLIIILVMLILSMCMNMLSSGSIFMGAVSYVANYEDIDDASILYTELETDLQIYLQNIEANHSGFDEYRYSVGAINHNPFELMAYLTAVYGEFTFGQVESVIREIFAQQYQLTLSPVTEIRTRTETRVDENGNTYTVTVEYEWRILNVTLQSSPLSMVLFSRMSYEERQHFNILMASRGARQIVGNPFDFNWLPHLSSRYGFRICPINGGKAFHAGIDMGLPTGTPILAGFDGIVTSVGYAPDGYGRFVVIDNGAGLQALYAHCDAILVSQGQSILEGDLIATVGNTGASTGAHLHMEVIRNGRHLNPLFFVMTGCEGGLGGLQYGDARPLTPEEFAILYAEAISHLGKPYVYGANGPDAFDCSSFVAWVFRHSGIYPLARTTAQGIFNQSTPIPMSYISPGDIVFFTRTYSTTDTVTHLGIYVGNGMMIHAGTPVNITSINTVFWQSHFYAVGRLNW